MAIHGYPRFTRDIDMLIAEQSEPYVLRAVQPLGFQSEGGRIPLGIDANHPMDLVRISTAQGKDLLMPDLILVSSTLETVWHSRETILWNGRRLSVVSRAGLTTMKRLAGRPQDLLDVHLLEGAP